MEVGKYIDNHKIGSNKKEYRLEEILKHDELFEAYGVENGVTHDDNDRIISTAPIYMVRQGDITSDILEYSNLRGRYWTNGKMYNPYFQNNPNMMEYYSYTFWQPNYLYYFHYSVGHPGLPVRCLAR